jgi:hypothetical protein
MERNLANRGCVWLEAILRLGDALLFGQLRGSLGTRDQPSYDDDGKETYHADPVTEVERELVSPAAVGRAFNS